MPTLLETRFNARALLAADRAFGVSVTITRGATTSSSFTAQRDVTTGFVFADAGVPVAINHQTFWLPVDGVNFGSGAVEPRTGDVITEGTTTWEVLPSKDDQRSVRLESGGYRWIVHTKRVS